MFYACWSVWAVGVVFCDFNDFQGYLDVLSEKFTVIHLMSKTVFRSGIGDTDD